MTDALGEKLRDAAVPESEGRREEVIRLALGAPPRRLAPERPPSRRWSLRAPIAIAAALVLIMAVTLTPPGRAIADGIAHLVGIGDEPTLDPSKDQDLKASGRAVVVATGTIPGTDQSIEFSAYASTDAPTGENLQPGSGPPVYDLGPTRTLSCLNADLPGLESQKQVEFESLCIDHPVDRPLDLNSSTDNLDRLGGEARFRVGGTLSDEVAKVEVTYEDRSGQRVAAPVIVARLDESIAEETGAPLTFGLFQAYLPDDGSPTNSGVVNSVHPVVISVEVKAFDAEGNELASESGRKFLPPPPTADEIRNARLLRRECARGWESGICDVVAAEP